MYIYKNRGARCHLCKLLRRANKDCLDFKPTQTHRKIAKKMYFPLLNYAFLYVRWAERQWSETQSTEPHLR